MEGALTLREAEYQRQREEASKKARNAYEHHLHTLVTVFRRAGWGRRVFCRTLVVMGALPCHYLTTHQLPSLAHLRRSVSLNASKA